MIKANELRIGNWVSLRGIGNVQVIGFDIAEWEKLEGDPIRLTPTILEKAGFVMDGEFYLHPSTMIFELTQKFKELGYWWAVRRTSLPAAIVIKERFCYVHQLQNLYFALTGAELEIAL